MGTPTQTLLNELVEDGIIAAGKNPDLALLMGGRALRAVAVSANTQATARTRTTYLHTYNEEVGYSTVVFNEGDIIPLNDISFLSYDEFTRFEQRFIAEETVFDNRGSFITENDGSGFKPGQETISIPKDNYLTSCAICYRSVDISSPETIFTPFNPDIYKSRHSAYIMSMCSNRSICNTCYDAGFVTEGREVDTADYLNSISDHNTIIAFESDDFDTNGLSGHALNRLSRLNTTVPISSQDILNLSWNRLTTTNITQEDDTAGDHNDNSPSYAPGTRDILYAQAPKEWWSCPFRRFNCSPVIYMASVLIGVDSSGRSIHKVMTVLPSIYSIEIRQPPANITASIMLVEDDVYLTSKEVKDCITNWTYFVRKGYDYINSIGKLPIMLTDASRVRSIGTYSIMSRYEIPNCYACHRVYRGDVGSRCSGTICPFSGRVALFDGLAMTLGLKAAIIAGDDSFNFEGVVSQPELSGSSLDEYAITRDTRCEMSGKAFICTTSTGKLMRPQLILEVSFDIEGSNMKRFEQRKSCIACWIRHKRSNNVKIIGRIDNSTPLVSYYQLRVKDRNLYNKWMEKVFSVVEVPTVFPKTTPMSVDSLGPRASADQILNYLSSAQGDECELVYHSCVNSSSGSLPTGLVYSTDAWDNQYNMSLTASITSEYSLKTSREIRSRPKTSVETISSHLGDGCLVQRYGGKDPKIVDNTRFVISNVGSPSNPSQIVYTSFIPNVNDCVQSSLDTWLKIMPVEYLKSLYIALVQYRSAIKALHDIDTKVSNSPTAGLGSLPKPEDKVEQEVASTLLVWGVNGSAKTRLKGLFSPDRFGTSGTPDCIERQMVSVNITESRALVAYVQESFKVRGINMSTSDFNSVRAHTPVEYLLSRVGGESDGDAYTTFFRNIVTGIRKERGYLTPIINKSLFINGALNLTMRSVDTGGGNWVLRTCAESGVPSRPSLTFRDIWEESFVYINERSEKVTPHDAVIAYNSSRSIGLLRLIKTPTFIAFEASRAAARAEEVARNTSIRTVYDSRLSRMPKEYAEKVAYQDNFEYCYLSWDDGSKIPGSTEGEQLALSVRFTNSEVVMRWGVNLRNSTILSKRIVTTQQNYNNSYTVITLRETQTNALEITRARKIGSGVTTRGPKR